jgi:hypothetical protein
MSLPSSESKSNPSKKPAEVAGKLCWFLACFLLGLPFDPEDGVGILLQNAGPSPNYTALQSRIQHSSLSPLYLKCNTNLSG